MIGFSRSIALVGNPWYRHFFADLGALIKQRHGAQLHVYCVSKEGCELFRAADRRSVFTSFNVMPSSATYQPGAPLNEVDVVARARQFEGKYDLTYNCLMVSDRLFGRGYAPGGYHHPRSLQSEAGSIVDALHIYNRQFEFWEQEFATKRHDMIMEVNNPLQAVVARKHGALVRNPTPARHRNLYYWTTDEYGYCDGVEQVFRSRRPLAGEGLAGAPHQGKMFNEEAIRSFRLRGVVGAMVRHTRNHLEWRLRGYFKARQYRWREQIALAWRRRRDYLVVSGPRTTRLAELKGRQFVFYAMHVEPELWFQGRSPEYFYQHAAIVSLSRDLPAGVILAVKEHHPGIGRRPDGFYDQILDLKNVRLIHVDDPGLQVVHEASAIATISGTVGQEAAVLGKPVITFGRHNLYNVLDHVRVVTREEDLKPALAWALDNSGTRAEFRRDGERFLASVVASSFDMKAFTARTIQAYDAESVEQAYGRLVESLQLQGGGALSSLPTDASVGRIA